MLQSEGSLSVRSCTSPSGMQELPPGLAQFPAEVLGLGLARPGRKASQSSSSGEGQAGRLSIPRAWRIIPTCLKEPAGAGKRSGNALGTEGCGAGWDLQTAGSTSEQNLGWSWELCIPLGCMDHVGTGETGAFTCKEAPLGIISPWKLQTEGR